MVSGDSFYHRMFSHPGMVAQLLREFVAGPWLDTLDLEAMERVNAKFHGPDGTRREGDVIWRIPTKDGSDVYLYLMLEFQSAPDRWMAVRVMVYVSLLWQQLIKEKRLTPDGRLPPVLPIVLYNGDPRWGMPLSLKELIALPEGSPFWKWQPHMEYHLIDEGAFAREDLESRDSLAALLFRLEHCRDPDAVVGLVDDVIDWFRGRPAFDALKPVFAMLAHRVIELNERARPGVRVSENLLEVKTMLTTRMETWKKEYQEQWREVGIEEGRREGMRLGIEQGIEQGIAKGEAMVLVRLLERRFGPLPGWTHERIAAADTDTLEDWSLRVLDAETLEEVFK